MPHNIIKDAQKHLPAKATNELKDFLKHFCMAVPREDLGMIDTAMLAKAAERHLKLSKKRKPGTTEIHIHTPTKAQQKGRFASTVIDIVNDDMPFLVDSVAAEITHHYKLIHLLVHPMLHIKRNKNGSYKVATDKKGNDTFTQSHIHIELQGTIAAPVIRELEQRLRKVINDVYYATRDWQDMRLKLQTCQDGLKTAPKKRYSAHEISEYLSFLEYLYHDNFTLLGYREYKFTEKKGEVASSIVKKSSLGLLHDQVTPVFISEDDDGLPQDLQRYRRDLPALSISKVNKRSTVHRSVPLDAIAVKQFDKKGKVIGECLFIGLFTSVTYSRSIEDVPLLRLRTDNVMKKSGFTQGSHDYKALRHVLEKYPRDELFQMNADQILETGVSIMRLQERQRIALYTRPDPFGRYVSCLVYVPRDRYDTRLRLKIHDILEQSFHGEVGDFYTNLDDSPLARLMFVIYVNHKKKRRYDLDAIEHKLQVAGRLWSERLNDVMLEEQIGDEDEIGRLVLKYGDAFPVSYRESYEPKQALFDIRKIEEAIDTDALALDLYKCKACVDDEIRLKVYKKGQPVGLSAILPTLENMGLRVDSEMPFDVRPAEVNNSVWIHDFMMAHNENHKISALEKIKVNFEEAFRKIWVGEVEDDTLNALILNAGMDWRSVMILRTYVRYMRQVGANFGHRYIAQALNNHPHIAQHIVDLFKVLHDPARQDKAAQKTPKILKSIEKALEDVSALDEDRILRSLTNLVQATLRTNFFQKNENGAPKTYLSVKFESSKIKDIPKPVPYREIFVYSPRVEGVHLRGDVIARGGIRWSDRHEDFRTEVLGLMKAQQVKNSVIVPMGAKGGFVVKNPPLQGGRKAFFEEGVECYKRFIWGLLDITDNRKGTKVIPPKDVVRLDGDDPYLVVAADKGTATFSDIANGLSQDYGFWLDDAFASGGSAGYDHKKMGITARGAWESVKRHFRELNHDTQNKDFDVIGVGDMGGDVFGNGMLLSKHIRLIGAFNHLHIFCDPDPDAASSFKERQRLFKAVKGWGEYDTKKLSKGGRIFDRSEKSLKLTPEIKKRFDIESDAVTPSELMKAMLKSRADLLWFGGIGTYIKDAGESHESVGDKANDQIRVDAREVRSRVLGEGANLAITQAGRISYAKRGGKINADFIDNAGGVDSSDHEVNIKILMTDVMNNNPNMSLAQRNKLLQKMTDDIAYLVLRNNYQQAQAISMMERTAAKDLEAHAAFIHDLEREHGIDRKIEGLPDQEEIDKRLSEGKGLTRPELSIIQAYAKIFFSRDMLATDIPDLKEMQDYWLLAYFPEILRKKYSDEILTHRLRREIVATTLANSLVNRMGPLFIQKIMEKTGTNCADVALAYLVVREAFDIRAFWDDIEALDGKVPAESQLRAMQEISRMIERETVWFLTKLGRQPNISADIADFGKGIKHLYRNMDKIVPSEAKLSMARRQESHMNDGIPEELARHIAITPKMGASFDIIRLSMQDGFDLSMVAKVYFAVGSHFKMVWLRQQARHMKSDDRWTSKALDSLLSQLYACQLNLTEKILTDIGKDGGKGKTSEKLMTSWIKEHSHEAQRVDALLAEMQNTGRVDIPMLLIAEQRLRSLYEV